MDDGYSGASTERPAYKEMMNDVENKRVSTVIVKDQSRLGRDYLQTGLLMEITFPQYDVRFIAVNDGVDSINGVNNFAGIKNYFKNTRYLGGVAIPRLQRFIFINLWTLPYLCVIMIL